MFLEDSNLKIAFFDTKPYDKSAFEKFSGAENIKFKFFEIKLRMLK